MSMEVNEKYLRGINLIKNQYDNLLHFWRKEKEKKSKVVLDIDSEISSLFLPTDFHVVLCVGCMT